MGRAPCCDKANVKRGQWSPEEDATLKSYVETHGIGGNWIALPRKAGLRRCGKSCRLRWLNYLRPDIKHGGFTEEEDNIICTLYSQMGSRWSIIASQLPGRTDNDVKNYWNTKLKKKLLRGNTTLSQNLPTPSLPCTPKSQTYNPAFSASHYAQSQSSPTLTDINYGLLANTQSLSFGLIGVSEFGGAASSKNSDQNVNVSQSQEGSSINSGSSFAAMDTKFVCLQQQQPNGGGIEDVGILADFSFGYPSSDLVHGFWFQDKAGEVGPSCYPNSADFGYANVKPQELNQTTVVNYQY